MSENFNLIRHGQSGYVNMKKTIQGETPENRIDYSNQEHDLTPAGIELAKAEAEKFFVGLDPQKDELFFASSNEARTIGTANIYRQIAKERGFKIIKPDHSRNDHAEMVGEGDIRVLDALSLNPQNSLLMSIYNPDPAKIFNIDWKNVREETKARWQEAREIIEADDKGSWLANFAAHSSRIKEILKTANPEEKSAEDLFENNFKNIIKLMQFADNKIKQEGNGRSIKVLGFGHENYLVLALKQYFEENSINYCEAISFEVSDKGVKGSFRGKENIISQ